MNKHYKRLSQLYLSVSSSIALWPSVIALAFLALSFFVLYFERTAAVIYFEKHLLFPINTEPENARTILTTVASGIITLMVFSFSMVMIVLSQATANLTPRVVPGLISHKMNQVVLGVNIGSILYTLILILSFKPGEDNQSVPIIGILLAVLFAITCVCLFVYFIHSISRSIKPDTILTGIYKTTQAALEREVKDTKESEVLKEIEGIDEWVDLPSKEGGYLRHIEIDALNKIAQREDLLIEISISVGKFVVPGLPFLRLSRDIQGQEDLWNDIQSCFIFSLEEVAVFTFETGLRQICEVAVKALSPGINDPGTALSAIDFLTLLFLQRMEGVTPNCLLDEYQKVRIIKHPTKLEELIYRFLTPIRTYGKADVMVMRKLLLCLEHMLYADRDNRYFSKPLFRQVTVVRDEADSSIKSPADREEINKVLETINSHFTGQEDAVPLLS